MSSTADLDVSSVENNEDLSDDERGTKIDDDIYIPPAPKPACSLENKGARLIITQIVNENFKSYAGKQVLGPFHKCFTSIIGPNGSGKSNVIDSMLFVFGYRATKIRSKKISVLLHNSDQHRDVNSCKVEVHFVQIIDKSGHEDDYEIVPGSEFMVSRFAFKDNSSYYMINNKKVQFKEVARLLRSHGIDLDHNRFLILQGEVEQIAMMKPKAPSEHESGMLEFLEDIIGTSRYKDPLEKLDARVEQLNQERSEKLNRVKMVEKERANLEGPKNEAVKFIKHMNDLTDMKNKMYQKYKYEVQQEINEEQVKKVETEKEMSDIVNQLNVITDNKVAKNIEMKKLSAKIESATKEKEKYNELFQKIQSQDVSIQENLKRLSNKRKKTKESLSAEKEKLKELESVPEKYEREIEELKKHENIFLSQQAKEEAALKEVMASLQAKTQDLQDQKRDLQNNHGKLKTVADNAKSEYDIAKTELDVYLSTEQKENARLEQIRNNYENSKSALQDYRQKIKDFEEQIPVCECEIKEAQSKLNVTKEEEVEVLAQLRIQRQEVAEARSNFQANKSRGKIVDSLMIQKANGNLPGIFGRLGDLGGIDQKYDIAVSTACPQLDNIVVDTVTTGEKCIDFLKQANLGRATFIALEKQERLRANCNKRIKTPENVPRLFDLITVPDDRVRTAFYFALRDTLVANDLEQATRIAYGPERQRVVTLKGELIEPSGTMSGGGKTALRGRMGQNAVISSPLSDKRIEHMERKLNELENRAAALRQKQISYEDTIATLTPKLNSMKVDLRKYKIDIQAREEQEPVLKKQLKEQENRVKEVASNPAQVAKLTDTVEKLKQEFEKHAKVANEVDIQVQDLHKRIIDITEGRTKAAQKKLDDVNKKIDKARQDTTKLKVAIKTAERNAKKSREKVTDLEQDIKEAEEKLLSLNEERKEIEGKAKELLANISTESEKILELSNELSVLKEEFKEISKEENAIKASKIEFDQKVGNSEKLISDLKDRINKTERQLKTLQLEEIPGEKEMVLKTFTPEELEAIDVKKLQAQVTSMESSIPTQKPNLAVIQEYREKDLIYLKRATELDEITNKRNKMRMVYDELRGKRVTEFMGGFKIITQKLKEMYQMITLGGDAELELVDSLDPFTEGIVFSVRPPKKSWKNITNLSGGEKTLSSLALVFALHYYKPTPLYVMDEIDAALDFKNVSIVANYIKQRTKNAQFIIISLRSNMFELADYLVGIYKTYNCTKSLTINPKYYAKPEDAVQIQSSQVQIPAARKFPSSVSSQNSISTQPSLGTAGGPVEKISQNPDLTPVLDLPESTNDRIELQDSANSRKSLKNVSFAMDISNDSADLM